MYIQSCDCVLFCHVNMQFVQVMDCRTGDDYSLYNNTSVLLNPPTTYTRCHSFTLSRAGKQKTTITTTTPLPK
eukprot:m.231276 g.231276  ORF g.231276 m.231276 type:complete len:73 (-) comp17064_c6_seq1:505-723(-)